MINPSRFKVPGSPSSYIIDSIVTQRLSRENALRVSEVVFSNGSVLYGVFDTESKSLEDALFKSAEGARVHFHRGVSRLIDPDFPSLQDAKVYVDGQYLFDTVACYKNMLVAGRYCSSHMDSRRPDLFQDTSD